MFILKRFIVRLVIGVSVFWHLEVNEYKYFGVFEPSETLTRDAWETFACGTTLEDEMGENEVQMENTEQMQESHASSSDKIDLSLG